jgi:hypothetical protein
MFVFECLITFQLIEYLVFFLFSFQMYFDSSVSFSYLSFLNDLVWFPYLDLNVPPVRPIYDLVSLSDLTVAL